MKHSLSLLCFLLLVSCGTLLPQQQQYSSHTVVQGETVNSIARQYGVSPAAIIVLNPEVDNGIYPNTVLKIPREASIFDNADIYFKEHKVAPKETLYAISKQYEVSEDLIKKFNTHLYAQQIKAGEVIRIPVKNRSGSWDDLTNTGTDGREISSGILMHTVKKKETLSSISRLYETSVAEIKELNPNLGDILSEGTVLLVPSKEIAKEVEVEEGFINYVVKEREGFFHLQRLYGVTKEEIIKHNPLAGDGLKLGMVLKIPVSDFNEIDEVILTNTVVNLKEHIRNRSEKNIALMLPLRLNRVHDQDSISQNTRLLQRDATLRIALDFYRGAILAAEAATEFGLPVSIQVFDTEGSPAKVSRIISENNFKQFDAVIGPVLASEVEQAAKDLERENVAVFSPLTNRVSGNYRNLVQTLPSSIELENMMYEYIKENSNGKNVILITDLKSNNPKYTRVRNIAPGVITVSPTEKGFLYLNEIQPFLSKDRENWIVLESSDPLLVSNVVGMLNGIVSGYTMQLMTTDKNAAYDYHDVSNQHLSRLKFTFPSINKSFHIDEDSAFIESYKEKFNSVPNRYVIRGYDLTLDVLLRLASDKNIYKALEKAYLTEYIENKFQYSSKAMNKYENRRGYIVQLTKELNLEVLE